MRKYNIIRTNRHGDEEHTTVEATGVQAALWQVILKRYHTRAYRDDITLRSTSRGLEVGLLDPRTREPEWTGSFYDYEPLS